jgi:ABC-2 type transport system permease protein
MFVPPIADFLGLPILKEEIFRFNSVKGQFLGFDYSLYNGYGSQLIPYFVYKLYWLTAGIGLLLLTLLTWKRGYTFTIKERLDLALSRFQGYLKFSFILGFIVFIAMGFGIYYQEYHVSKVVFSEKFTNDIMARNEKLYRNYENLVQPILSDVKLEMEFYPETKSYKLTGNLSFINKDDHLIDTIVIAKSFKDETTIEIKNIFKTITTDDTMHYEIVKLESPLARGDTFNFQFQMENFENSFLHHNSRIIKNGSYILGNIIPQLHIRDIFIKNKKKRKQYNLPERTFKELTPNDSTLLGYKNSTNNMGLINYECIVSTSKKQQAFTMGTLEKKWESNNRIYFQYKSKQPIVNTISWMSGEYEKNTSSSEYIALEMYRHRDNDRNDAHVFNGIRASLDYCSSIFGKLNYDTLKMVEFPITFGTYATVNGNLVPFSETYLQCDIHDHKNKTFNIPFFVAAHETAHHWWGHRVNPANINGSRIITEGMADYLAFKTVEKEYGYEKAYDIRKKMFNLYLKYRAELANETPLIYSSIENEYLNYRKASMVLYTLSNYLGEEQFNTIVSNFENTNRYKTPPFVTSLDFVQAFKDNSPDSLKYLITDLFEDITLYDNEITDVKSSNNEGLHTTHINFRIIKYNSDNKGKRIFNSESIEDKSLKSLMLRDYVDITLFDTQDKIIHDERTLITKIKNTLNFKTDKEVTKIAIDNSLLLIDANLDDNVWKK